MLIKARREVREPFTLSIIVNGGDQCEVTINKILRLLPGKRIVAVADDGNRLLLVKLFIGRFASRYKKREATGVKAIMSAGVNTPGLLWQGKLKSGGGFVLAFEYLDGSCSLTDEWEELTSQDEQLALLARVMSVLAKLHEAGVVQNDIHPGNFLTRAGTVYTIDGGDVTSKVTAPLSTTKSLQNLALFFAQFYARFDNLVPEALRVYGSHRAWDAADDERCAYLGSEIKRFRELRKADYVQKAFRECTRFSCQRGFSGLIICERKHDSAEMRALLADLDGAISSGKILKAGNSATVALVDGPRGPLAVKRYNMKNTLHRLSRMVRNTRAWTSWANTFRLEFLGINTLRPVALVENRFGPLRGTAYFVTEYVDAPDATNLPEMEDSENKMSSIVNLLKCLSEAGFTHSDLKASNFLMSPKGPVIIDLDSMKEHRGERNLQLALRKDLDRFVKNWEAPTDQKFADLLDGTFHLQ